jgi:phospholipid-binding lipoprotein MlaA
VLPLFGPSDFRDAPTRLIDTYTEVPHYAPKPIRTKTGLIVRGARGIDQRAQLIGADEAINNAFDPYALLRDAYVRQRQYNVMDGNVPAESFDDDVETEGTGAGPAAAPAADPATAPAASPTDAKASAGPTAGS